MSFLSKEQKFLGRGLTYDDVLLMPLESDVLPNEVSLKTRLAGNVMLNIPFMTAAMDTVTESEMAIAVAQEGGIGVIHKNMTPEQQANEVKRVKSATPLGNNPALDHAGRLIVAAALGATDDLLLRASGLCEVGVDVFVLDSAHGHHINIRNAVKKLKEAFPDIPVIAGNIATAAGAEALIEVGADAIKVGMGPGSICTTRVVAGIGVPQVTAVFAAAEVAHKYNIPVIADGGLKYSGDIPKALAAGASAVMVGSIVAGTVEAPGDVIEKDGKTYKVYRGMGSLASMQHGSKERYFQEEGKKLVPEGIEGLTPVTGSVSEVIYQLMGGLRAGMGYCGCADIETMWTKAQFVEITFAGFIEGHPHDILIEKDAPNYTKK